jgi:hypothetical protein
MHQARRLASSDANVRHASAHPDPVSARFGHGALRLMNGHHQWGRLGADSSVVTSVTLEILWVNSVTEERRPTVPPCP